MGKIEIHLLLKFSSNLQHLEELVKNGKIRFNHYQTYISTPKGEKSKRFDENEGATYSNQPENTKIILDDHEFKLAESHQSRFTIPPAPFVYCMCCVTNESILQGGGCNSI